MNSKLIDFIILTGFLGSGKTTLLTDFLADGIRDTAVIVNDIGEVNIDGAIIAVRSGVPMATLSNGCVCCSLTNDLLFTIQALIDARRQSVDAPFARIVLECSGISHPGAVMRSLSELAHLNMRVRIVCTYACDQDVEKTGEFELAVAQLSAAHTIVLTRLDLSDREGILKAIERSRALGPMADLVVDEVRSRRAELAIGVIPKEASLLAPRAFELERKVTDDRHPRINTFVLSTHYAVDWHSFEAWLENLAGYLEERLLRVKGFLTVAECKEQLLIQGVGQHFETPRRIYTQSSTTRIVIIARDTSLEEVSTTVPKLQGAIFT